MEWKDKIGQLIALLEKIPQPQTFDHGKGVYEPYFVVELRPANWELVSYAEYTRLDGQPGKEVKLNFQVVESQKVNITQDELNVLSYIYSFTNLDTRRLFSYGQPLGFIFEWLADSRLKLRTPDNRELKDLTRHEEVGNLSLGIFKQEDHYVLQPAIVFPDYSLTLEERTDVLTANPLFLLYRDTLYQVESNLPAFFWMNFFRLQQRVDIPVENLEEFIESYVPTILPAIDWKSLEEYLKLYELPLGSTRIYFKERAGNLQIDVAFRYENLEFPAHPVVDKSLATQGKYLFVVKRDEQKEKQLRRLLQEHGLFYIQHRWQIDPQYKTLDWLRLKIPELSALGIESFGEERLSRFRLRRGTPALKLKIKSGPHGLDLGYRLEQDGRPLSILNLKESLNRGKAYFKLSDGSSVFIPPELLERLKNFFGLLNIYQPSGSSKFQTSAIPLITELSGFADQVEGDETYRHFAKKYKEFNRIQELGLPKKFSGKLRDYQRAGLNWLGFLNRFGFGGILADDMGLGKTVQLIALLQHLKSAGELRNPVLIAVPLTVMFNWEAEIAHFAPELRVMRYQGQRVEREQKVAGFRNYDIVLMSYGILLQDQQVFQNQEWDYLILDESQKIKNPGTKTYQAAVSVKCRHRLCLTGTPIENSVLDLWAQFNFLNPGMLGSRQQFEERFIKNGADEPARQELLKRIIFPFMLRRKKEDVLQELPRRTDIVQVVEMTDAQRQVYGGILEGFRERVLGSVDRDGLAKSRMLVLEALTALRQVACHPAILQPDLALEESGKLLLLTEMLEELLQEGHKVLVFSQFVRFLELVRRMVQSRGWSHEYLDGSTRNREQRIQNFQKDPSVSIFIISLKAGGLGLNLTAADYVIHLDPWWNPAVEQQATDRAHRIGQENPVFVYKYIVKDSVEEKILQLQQRKKELSDRLVTTEKGLVKELSREDIEVIFRPVDKSD